MWDELPELILIQIFSYLSRVDRANVNQICSLWSSALSAPILWRSVTVLLDRDLIGDHPITIDLKNYGRHVHNLELAWSRPNKYFRDRPVVQMDVASDFLDTIKTWNVQIKKLVLTNWTLSRSWGHRGELIFSLANFIGCQRKLETLSLLNANLCVSDVLRLLGTVARVSKEHLTFLDLRGSFREWQTSFSNPRYLRMLSRLSALTTLKLDYPSLSDQVLDVLANAAPRVLRTLSISVRESDSRQHMITDATWHNLVVACPDLLVSYTIVNISHYEDMQYLLRPSVPLAYFQMFSGHVWDQSRSRNFRATVGLLIDHYSKTLVEVVLQLRNNRELLDDLLLALITQCKQLNKLQYDGIMRNLDTVRNICQLQIEYKTRFRTIHVKPRNVNDNSRLILDDIVCQYDNKLTQQGVDFQIDNSAAVLIFY